MKGTAMKTDILIVGSGCSGLYAALNLPRERKITVISKSDLETNDSYLAQGGMCVLKDESDYSGYFEDTMRAGHFENDPESVDIMIHSSQGVLHDLLDAGVVFARKKDGSLDYTREGCHREKRIVYHEDITGKEITSHLLERVKMLDNVTLVENATLVDIICQGNSCFGGVVRISEETKSSCGGRETAAAGTMAASTCLETVEADYTILATGGVGGLYQHSTNYKHLTGDAFAIALMHGIAMKDINYVQIHPTTLYSEKKEDRSFLISESVRGEGAKLYDKNMERFTDELLPRDKLTEAIHRQMEKDGTAFVWEDLRPIGEEQLNAHFPNIVKHCAENGYDVTRECIPVVPAQHYYMGGIRVDHQSKTSMDRLYAVGETACNGVHGRNRLASNSLLESMVFAKRAAEDMTEKYSAAVPDQTVLAAVDLGEYRDAEALADKYRDIVLTEIKKADERERRADV
jgi:L-aspartate oxidase